MNDEAVSEMRLENPKLQRFYDYWRSKIPPDGRFPARQDIEPTEIPDLLASVIMIDVVRRDEGVRFRVRLAGTEYVKAVGWDRTGHWVDADRPAEEGRAVVATYHEVLDTGEPHYWLSQLHDVGRQLVPYERLMCPLAEDGETIDVLIGLVDFSTPARPKDA